MKKLLMLILAGLFSAGVAVANEDVNFEQLDQDGDSQLSRTEVSQDSELAAQFSTLDANGDGYLDKDEAKSSSSSESQDDSMGEDY